MSAGLRPEAPDVTAAHAITYSEGPHTNTQGSSLAVVEWAIKNDLDPTPAAALGALLEAITWPGKEPWWSPHTWTGDSRESYTKWLAAAALVVDVDYHDEAGEHTSPPDDLRARLAQAATAGRLPGNLHHDTPRGARLVLVPPEPIIDADLYRRAILGAYRLVREALAALGLHARQEGGTWRGGFVVDTACHDLKRFYFTPNGTVKGELREATVTVLRPEPLDLAELPELEPEVEPAAASPSGNGRPRAEATADFEDAVRRWNRDHPQTWPAPGKGKCPICGHSDCFGTLRDPDTDKLVSERWACFSANHRAGGMAPTARRACWIGDALDVEAHARNCRRVDVLVADGYLSPATKPDDAQDVFPAEAAPQGEDAPAAEAAHEARERPRIAVRNKLEAVTDEAVAALLADPAAGIFVRARQLVRIVRDSGKQRGGLKRDPGSPVIVPLPLDALRERLDRAAEWVKLVNEGEGDKPAWKARPALPPEWVGRTITARDSWPFPDLEAVIEAPTLRRDGTLLDVPGYDPASGLMFIPSGRFPVIPAHPTPQDALEAARCLLEPFADFPFVAASDRAAAVAAALSLVARHAIDGCVPLFAVRAPTPGSGKSLLADVVSIIGTGHPAARTTVPREDAELRKVLLAVALEGSPAVLLDNVDGALGSQSLAAAITARVWSDRVLGLSARATAPLTAVWIATGNGLTFRGDLGRRVAPIDLDPQLEHPEDRTDFTHPDLRAWVREHRGGLVAAGLTALRAYHVAGRPAHGEPRWGSFEEWDDLVRGAVVWLGGLETGLGFGDPRAGAERIRREDDTDLAALSGALEAWWQAFGAERRTAADAVAAAGDGTPLRAALLGLMSERDKLEPRTLGYALRRVRDRIVGGLRFTSPDRGRTRSRRAVEWQVIALDRGEPDPPAEPLDKHDLWTDPQGGEQ